MARSLGTMDAERIHPSYTSEENRGDIVQSLPARSLHSSSQVSLELLLLLCISAAYLGFIIIMRELSV